MPATSTILLTSLLLSAARSSVELIAYREPGGSDGEGGEGGEGGGGEPGSGGEGGGDGGGSGGEGDNGGSGGSGGVDGGGASCWMVTSVPVHAELHHACHVARPCGGEDESVELM